MSSNSNIFSDSSDITDTSLEDSFSSSDLHDEVTTEENDSESFQSNQSFSDESVVVESTDQSFGQSYLIEEFRDVTFILSDRKNQKIRISAHKCVVAGASPEFEKMFAGELENRNEVIITDVDPQSFCHILRLVKI